MQAQNAQSTNDVLLSMYKEANQLLTQKVRELSLDNARLSKDLQSVQVRNGKWSLYKHV